MSEITDRVLLKKYEEFMSRKCNFEDFIRLRANKVHQGMTLEFGALSLFFRVDGKLFLQHGNITLKTIDNPTRKQVDEVYHFFTGEHLDFMPTKVYNWENCFSGNGYYLDNYGNLKGVTNQPNDGHSENIYPTQEDAESALAHCQLLHIVNKINEDYPRKPDMDYNYFICVVDNVIDYSSNSRVYNTFGGLTLKSSEGVRVLIKDNEELLKTYLKIK